MPLDGPPASSLAAAPSIADWLDLSQEGRVRVLVGKVEIGQGILTVLAQIAARALSVDPSRIEVVSGRTGSTPNEGYTAGSLSVLFSGTALEAACSACVALLRDRLVERCGAQAGQAILRDGCFIGTDVPDGTSIWSLSGDLDVPVGEQAAGAPYRPDETLSRIDLPDKVRGGGMIHDIAVEDMLHARIVRPPRFGAAPVLDDLNVAADVELFREGDFLAVIGRDEAAVSRQAERLNLRVEWTGGLAIGPELLDPMRLRDMPGQSYEIGDSRDAATGEKVSAVYHRPYLMHGSIGCVAALARWDGQSALEVISQAQGPYPLRASLARLFGLDIDRVTVVHAAGAGCYGHNGADDVAAEAAVIARRYPGRTVRLMWTRAEELSAAPLGPAGEAVISAHLDENGLPRAMELDVASATFARRPGIAADNEFMVELHMAGQSALPAPIEVPVAYGSGALRNAISGYAIDHQHARLHLVDPPGLRTSALRGLGAHLNVFAIECFIDELAARCDSDPLAYRLDIMKDDRARAVLARVAEIAGWAQRPEGGGGEGWGIAYSRYKGIAAHAAMVAKVTVDEAVKLEKVWCCVDAGRVFNLDGLRNQIEGGIVQSASWALIEEVRLNEDGLLPQRWDEYPIMRFGDVPEIELDVMTPDDPAPLGAGEAAVGPTTAAIGNAVSHALGVRLRQLPFSRDRVTEALLSI